MKKFHYMVLVWAVTSLFVWTACTDPPEGTRTDGKAKRCQVHKTQLKTKNGFTFGGDVMAEPSSDYVRFMDETRFPNTVPWEFSKNQTDICTQRIAIEYCPTCEAEFQKGFADYQRMTEAEKEARFVESLRGEAEIKKQKKPAHDSP